ncbi:MAG TPA: DUF3568 family protein [Pyrinomonadaceae bacterium]|nr:DUF3568 family protein [Pyrinomonadaceae bacterium]
MRGNRIVVLIALAAACMTSGCTAVALTGLGVGASAGVSHGMGGYTYKTFSLPIPKVRGATLTALNRMAINVESTEKVEGGEVIKAKSGDRDIEVMLEAVSPNTTRMRTITKKGALFYDSATSTEIILQTEKVLTRA